MKYVAFLRGINVGGHKLIKMEELARLFVEMEFSHVRTVIASGNVVFESDEQSREALIEKIEKHLLQSLEYEVKVLLRTMPEVQEMVARNPFKDFTDNKDVKFYVALLSLSADEFPNLPLKSEKDGFEVVNVSDCELYIVTYQLPNGRFSDLSLIGKTIGTYSTTRNWNTIVRIATDRK